MQTNKIILLCGPDQEIGNDKLKLGRHTRAPFIVGGRNTKPFPVVIFCNSAAQADHIYEPLRNFTVQHHAIEDIDALFAAAEQSTDIAAVSKYLDRQPRLYWVVVSGHRVGIYFSRFDAKQSLDSAPKPYRICCIQDTFLSAFKCALCNGRSIPSIAEVTELPNEDNENDTRARTTRFHPYYVGNTHTQRQRGYDDRDVPLSELAARSLVTWGLTARTLSITALIHEARSKADFIDNIPRFMDVDKATLLWDLNKLE